MDISDLKTHGTVSSVSTIDECTMFYSEQAEGCNEDLNAFIITDFEVFL